MVYDCFMLLNEIDLLEIRLNVLKDVVDKFVITEATTTQMGDKRELCYPKYQYLFEEFKDRIIYNVCDDAQLSFPNQWEREHYQKDYVINGLEDALDEDIIVFSDVDEIPNPSSVKKVLDSFDSNKIYHFAQRMFNFYLNYENIDNYLLAYCNDYDDVDTKRWIGSKICTVGKARSIGIDDLRHPDRLKEPGERVADGGWHFSYLGGYRSSVRQRVKNKLKSFSHHEFSGWKYYNIFHIKNTIKSGKDFLGREALFSKVEIDDTYPEYILKNKNRYVHLILK